MPKAAKSLERAVAAIPDADRDEEDDERLNDQAHDIADCIEALENLDGKIQLAYQSVEHIDVQPVIAESAESAPTDNKVGVELGMYSAIYNAHNRSTSSSESSHAEDGYGSSSDDDELAQSVVEQCQKMCNIM